MNGIRGMAHLIQAVLMIALLNLQNSFLSDIEGLDLSVG